MSSCTCFVVQSSASGTTASLVRSHSYVLTCALANNNPPPMGANMIPMAKNNGRTVLGVRIGLRYCQMGLREGFQRPLTAMPSVAVDGKQYLQRSTIYQSLILTIRHPSRDAHLLASCSSASCPRVVDWDPARQSSRTSRGAPLVYQPS
jgi:hypothetical protein